MLQAIKNGTLTELQVRSLEIRGKELDYWTKTFGTMATQAALIAGFSYGGLTVEIAEDTTFLLATGYLISTTFAMGFGLLAITIATFCTMLGPGMALRGGQGADSMHKAVEALKKYSKNCFKFFMLSLLSFHISSFLLVWLFYPAITSIIVNLVLVVFLIMFIQNGTNIYDQLYVPEENAVSSKFDQFGLEMIPDLDKRRSQDVSYSGATPGYAQSIEVPGRYPVDHAQAYRQENTPTVAESQAPMIQSDNTTGGIFAKVKNMTRITNLMK